MFKPFKPNSFKSFNLFLNVSKDFLIDKISAEILLLCDKYPNEWLNIKYKQISIFFKLNAELIIVFNEVDYLVNNDLDSIKNCLNELGIK